MQVPSQGLTLQAGLLKDTSLRPALLIPFWLVQPLALGEDNFATKLSVGPHAAG